MKNYQLQKWFGRGRMLDVWSVPHFFFGVVAAVFSLVFGFSFLVILFSILPLAIAWEWIEVRIGIYERLSNRIMDCILPLIGFILAHHLLDYLPVSLEQHPAMLATTLCIFFGINYISWEARFNGEREFLG